MELKYKIEYAELSKEEVEKIIKAVFDNDKAVIQEDVMDLAAVGFINSFECRLFWNFDHHVYIQPFNPEHMPEVLEFVDERKSDYCPNGYGVARYATENTISLKYVRLCCTE